MSYYVQQTYLLAVVSCSFLAVSTLAFLVTSPNHAKLPCSSPLRRMEGTSTFQLPGTFHLPPFHKNPPRTHPFMNVENQILLLSHPEQVSSSAIIMTPLEQSIFVFSILLHWILWAKSPRWFALCYDMICILYLLYQSSTHLSS